MKTIHNITTKVINTEFWFWHYTVLLYDDKEYELYEMSRPIDRNWVNILLDQWPINNLNMEWYDRNTISMEELMDERNTDIRKAIKQKQESFYR